MSTQQICTPCIDGNCWTEKEELQNKAVLHIAVPVNPSVNTDWLLICAPRVIEPAVAYTLCVKSLAATWLIALIQCDWLAPVPLWCRRCWGAPLSFWFIYLLIFSSQACALCPLFVFVLTWAMCPCVSSRSALQHHHSKVDPSTFSQSAASG